MKNLRSMMAIAALTIAAALPLCAQYSRPIKLNVPFNFVVENDRLPAGDYTIQKIGTGRLLLRRGGANATSILVFRALPTEAKTTAEQGRLIFHAYGREHFLSRIWTPGLEVGWEVLEGKLETELAKRGVAMEMASIATH
jgi:hypothetical protein